MDVDYNKSYRRGVEDLPTTLTGETALKPGTNSGIEAKFFANCSIYHEVLWHYRNSQYSNHLRTQTNRTKTIGNASTIDVNKSARKPIS